MVSGLTFTSLIHFELIVLSSVRWSLISFFFHMTTFPHILYLKGCPIPIEYSGSVVKY